MDKDNIVWEIPVHRSLIKPLYWMGVPRGVLIGEILVAILGGVFARSIFVPLLMVGVHFLFRHLGEKDSMFMDVFLRYVRHNKFYG